MLAKRNWLLIGIAAVVLIGAGVGIITYMSKRQNSELVLSDYPELFKKDAMIIVGGNASQIELESAEAIAAKLEELTGNKPEIKNGTEIAENAKENHNLVLIGTPNSNNLLQEVYLVTDATRVTKEYPGKNKGLLEILRSPWNEDRGLLLVVGSDEWGVKVGELMIRDQKLEKKNKTFVNWEEYTGVEFPIDSEEEAIRYAQTEFDANEFIKEWAATGRGTKIMAEWDSYYDVWEVDIRPIPKEGIIEIMFVMRFKRDGSLIEKGIFPTA